MCHCFENICMCVCVCVCVVGCYWNITLWTINQTHNLSNTMNPFANEVASAFCLKRRCNPFGNKKKAFYCVWAPRFFASETQERKKQHFAALWTLFTLNLISMNSVAHTVKAWIALFTWTVQFTCTVHTLFFFFFLHIKKN
jgi:hypothetical protein